MAHRSSADALRVSVIVPCRDEAGNIPALIDVDDGSTDDSAQLVGVWWLRRRRKHILEITEIEKP